MHLRQISTVALSMLLTACAAGPRSDPAAAPVSSADGGAGLYCGNIS